MKKQIKVGAILGYINMILNILISLFYIPFMLKYMGQSEFGLYSLITSVIAYLSILDLGFGNSMIRYVSKSESNKIEVAKINGMFLFLYSIIGLLSLIIGVVLIFNAGSIFASSLTIYEIEKAKILLMILVINVSLSFPLSVFDSYIISNEKYVYSKSLFIIQSLSKPVIMIPLLLLGFKSIAMTLVVATLNIAIHIAMAIYCFKKLNMKFSFSLKNIDKKLLKEIFIYSFFIFLSIIVDKVFNSTDQVILGIVSGTVAVSVYAVAQQIINMNTQCSTVIGSLFLPKITKLLKEKESDKKISNIFITVSRIQIYIMMLILFGFIIFGKFFINLWAGIEYLDAYYIIVIILLSSIVPLTQNIGISVIQAKNQHQFRSIIYFVIAILNIAISIPLAKQYGGIGAAIGTAIAALCGQIISMNIFYYKKSKLDIPTYWKFFVKMFVQYSLLSGIFMLCFNYIEMNKITFIIGIILFIVMYFLISYLNFNDYEKDLIKRLKKIYLKRLWKW